MTRRTRRTPHYSLPWSPRSEDVMDSRGCSAEPGGPAKGTDSLPLIPAIALEDALSSIFERPKKGKGTHVHGGESLSKAGMETVNVPLSDFFLDYSQINDVTKNVVSLRASLRQLFDEEKLQQNAESNIHHLLLLPCLPKPTKKCLGCLVDMDNGTRFAILLLVLCYCWMFKCSTLSWTNTTMEGDINKDIHHHINNHHPSEGEQKKKKRK